MPAINEGRYVVNAGWDDVPHLNERTKAELLRATPPYLRAARSKGMPSMGEGAIYPIPWEEVSCAPFQVPTFWPRCYGLDVGWKMTAAIWVTQNPVDGSMYAYSEYARGEAPPMVHAAGIKARGDWIRGRVDPAARGRTQDEGKRLMAQYQAAGLKLALADNGVESGIHAVWSLLETGRLKFFTTLTGTESEYRLYRRQKVTTQFMEAAKVVKKNDHRMDALRYAITRFSETATTKPEPAQGAGYQPLDRKAGY